MYPISAIGDWQPVWVNSKAKAAEILKILSNGEICNILMMIVHYYYTLDGRLLQQLNCPRLAGWHRFAKALQCNNHIAALPVQGTRLTAQLYLNVVGCRFCSLFHYYYYHIACRAYLPSSNGMVDGVCRKMGRGVPQEGRKKQS